MITSEDLATVVVRRVIFHDIPQAVKGGSAKPTLSEVETEIDAMRKGHLKKKLIKVLGSKAAYPIQFSTASASPVPGEVRGLTKHSSNAPLFVESSQRLANYLFEQRLGSISPGLLCMVDATANSLPCVVLMKLERESGGQLELSDNKEGKKTFALSVFDNLVLTDGTRLFKTAMFVRTGKGDDDFRSGACDSQLNVGSSDDFAKFWLRFLGCSFVEEPRVATHRFYESVVRFVNKSVGDPSSKGDIYESLQSELKSHKKTLSPKQFIEEYIPEPFQNGLREHLKVEQVSATAFTKDLNDIERRLRRRVYETSKGVTVSVPEESANLVVVRPEQIIVNDSVIKVK